jgi:hypothetical protein
LRGHEQALAQRHAPAAERVGLDRIDRRRRLPPGEPGIDRAENESAQHRRAEGGKRRDPLGGAEVNVERDAEDRDMRDIDDLGHCRDA